MNNFNYFSNEGKKIFFEKEFVVSKLVDRGVRIISLSDTVGSADTESIGKLFENLSNKYKDIEFGIHLHTNPISWYKKVKIAKSKTHDFRAFIFSTVNME